MRRCGRCPLLPPGSVKAAGQLAAKRRPSQRRYECPQGPQTCLLASFRLSPKLCRFLGRPSGDAGVDARRRQASEKRQSTKSRGWGRLGCRASAMGIWRRQRWLWRSLASGRAIALPMRDGALEWSRGHHGRRAVTWGAPSAGDRRALERVVPWLVVAAWRFGSVVGGIMRCRSGRAVVRVAGDVWVWSPARRSR